MQPKSWTTAPLIPLREEMHSIVDMLSVQFREVVVAKLEKGNVRFTDHSVMRVIENGHAKLEELESNPLQRIAIIKGVMRSVAEDVLSREIIRARNDLMVNLPITFESLMSFLKVITLAEWLDVFVNTLTQQWPWMEQNPENDCLHAFCKLNLMDAKVLSAIGTFLVKLPEEPVSVETTLILDSVLKLFLQSATSLDKLKVFTAMFLTDKLNDHYRALFHAARECSNILRGIAVYMLEDPSLTQEILLSTSTKDLQSENRCAFLAFLNSSAFECRDMIVRHSGLCAFVEESERLAQCYMAIEIDKQSTTWTISTEVAKIGRWILDDIGFARADLIIPQQHHIRGLCSVEDTLMAMGSSPPTIQGL